MPRPYSIPARYRRNPYKNTTADRQRIFSIVWEWFVTRKHPRCHNGSNCMYRLTMEDNTKNACAVGIFIPSCVSPDVLEFIGSVSQLFKEFPTLMSRIFDPQLEDFLSALQESHDAGITPEQMRTLLRSFAVAESLTIPEPKP